MISCFSVSLICVCVIECSAQASDRGQCQGHSGSHCQYEWGLWIILYWPENNGATFQCPPNYTKNFKFTHENRIQFLDLSSLYARLILNEHYFSSTPRHKYILFQSNLYIWRKWTICITHIVRKSCVNIKGNHQSWKSRPRYMPRSFEIRNIYRVIAPPVWIKTGSHKQDEMSWSPLPKIRLGLD